MAENEALKRESIRIKKGNQEHEREIKTLSNECNMYMQQAQSLNKDNQHLSDLVEKLEG